MKAQLVGVPEEVTEWWISLSSDNLRRVISEIVVCAEAVNLTLLLPNVKVPTLMLTGGSGQLAAAEAIKSGNRSCRTADWKSRRATPAT
ncbi:MAG: hypothetical protein QGH66_05155 [Dehalococcoidia bacterium]|jgi:hypothetical protein|nr:hypothetical protein [Dehalococcoidia bacterium]